MTNGSLLDRRGKKELMVQLGMNKWYQEENQNLSDLDAVYYLSRTSVIALVLLMLNSMRCWGFFLQSPVRYFGCTALHLALIIACTFLDLLGNLLTFLSPLNMI